jgi:hypothetical protein
MPEDWLAFEMALHPDGTPSSTSRVLRRWQLTSTRYLLGPSGYVAGLNDQLDPIQRRFRVALPFEISLKSDAPSYRSLEDLTAVPKPDGQFAVIEFTGALPRAGLYADWRVNTNNQAALATLASQEFDPARTVMVDDPVPLPSPGAATNLTAGTVEFASYSPTHIVLKAKADASAILLLNDRYNSDWKVAVDGKPASLLRCNYLMRGVQVAPGAHTVEFRYEPVVKLLYGNIAAILVGIALIAWLAASPKRPEADETPA